jgi:SAM-dependent methyltransferase
MSGYDELYRRAQYYDIAFKRDVSREVDFVLDVARQYTGTEIKSIIDIACGPGYHAHELARRGLEAFGLDLQAQMLDIARERADAENLKVKWVQADMRNFRLDRPVDAAITLCNGVIALRTNEDYLQHLRSVADNLKPGGIYIVDLINPRVCSFENYGDYLYTGRSDGISVEIQWGTNNPRFDHLTGVAYVEIQMKVNDHGKVEVIQDSEYERLVLPQEFTLMNELAGSFKILGWYGNYDLKQPFDDTPKSDYLLAVLQKKQG